MRMPGVTSGRAEPFWGMSVGLFGVWLILLYWGVVGAGQRKTLQHELSQLRREHQAIPAHGVAEAEQLKNLLQRLQELDSAEPKALNTPPASGIELSADIQSFVHAYRKRLAAEGIELLQEDLGFPDAVGEMALVSSELELGVLSGQLQLAREVIDLAIEVAPLAMGGLRREADTDPVTRRVVYRLQFDMHGYTRSLRDWLQKNLYRETASRFRVLSIGVRRSPLSEQDRSLEWFTNNSTEAAIPRRVASLPNSPFSHYLKEPKLQSGMEGPESVPLIGEGVSRFQIVVERRAEL